MNEMKERKKIEWKGIKKRKEERKKERTKRR